MVARPLSEKILKRDGVELSWNGRFIKQRIAAATAIGLAKAAKHAIRKIKTKLLAVHGSIPVGSNKVKAVEYSSPGEIPFAQTENYANSWSWEYSKVGFEQTTTVFSEAPYGEALEQGGYSVTNPELEFTSLELVNRMPVVRYIAARPVAVPTMEEEHNNLLNIVGKEIRKVL